MNSDRNSIRFSLRPVMPFRLDLTVWALRRRSANTVDVWQDNTYRRVLAINDQLLLVEVTQKKTKALRHYNWTESLHRRGKRPRLHWSDS